MPKINSQGVVSYEPSRRPQLQAHPGTGVPMEPVVHPADGTLSPPVSNPPAPGEPAGEPLYMIHSGDISGDPVGGLAVLKAAAAETAPPGAPSLADAEAKIEAAQAELAELAHPVPPAGPAADSAPPEPVTLPPRRVPPPGA